MAKPRVYLAGGDGVGWALDDDLAMVRASLADRIEIASVDDSDVVHSAWWEGVLAVPEPLLAGKRVICQVPAEPFRYMAIPRHRLAMGRVGLWIVVSRQAEAEFRSVGVDCCYIPYSIDGDLFHPIATDDKGLEAIRAEYGIPRDRYLIGSFQRDTEGSDLRSPKLVKGPDILLETVTLLVRRGCPIHLVLAGPRRHWLRRQLAERRVPFTYAGRDIAGEDIRDNTVSRSRLNQLYNIIDLCVVASRSEGGPKAIMEAVAAQRRIVSRRVGLAADILEPGCLYASPLEAADLIERDLRDGFLARTIAPQHERFRADHTRPPAAERLCAIYDQLERIPVYRPEPGHAPEPAPVNPLVARVKRSRVGRCLFPPRQPTVGLWHKFFKPPYGGGNQFMMALRGALRRRGVRVRENVVSSRIDAYLLNSIHFDVAALRRARAVDGLRVLHRVDGPISLIRGHDREKDELCFELNRELADVTVVQSAWCLQRIVEMGYQPVKPVILHNAVDPAIFHREGRVELSSGRKIRLITSSWSDNPRKGGSTYRWLEDHLDWDRFEYTFVGRASEPFTRIRQVAPVGSRELAGELRRHDIYVTASWNDPCSNAVLEALACGLPVLYRNHGGHPELVGSGGLPFTDDEEILPQLEALVEGYEAFQRLIVVSDLDSVAGKYVEIFSDLAPVDG